MKQLGQHPPPYHVIAHLSDPHLLAGGQMQYGAVDTEAGLRLALERLAAVDPPPQALAFTGDLADKAEPAAYARLREIVEPAAAAMGAEVVWVMGNHPAAPAADVARSRADRAARPGPPRGILAGHLHFSTYSLFAGIPISVASGGCYTSDPAPIDRFVSGVSSGQAFTMVHAYADRLVHTIVPLDRGTEVNGLGLDIKEAIEGLSVAEARELASSKTSAFNARHEDHDRPA